MFLDCSITSLWSVLSVTRILPSSAAPSMRRNRSCRRNRRATMSWSGYFTIAEPPRTDSTLTVPLTVNSLYSKVWNSALNMHHTIGSQCIDELLWADWSPRTEVQVAQQPVSVSDATINTVPYSIMSRRAVSRKTSRRSRETMSRREISDVFISMEVVIRTVGI